MPFLFVIVCLILLSPVAFSQESDLQLVVQGVDDREGMLYVAVYVSAETFMQEENVFRVAILSVSGQSILHVQIPDLQHGTYAIAAFLDENDNARLDTNILGIPQELYGFSGSIRPRFRAPRFDEAAIEFTPETSTVEIRMR